jgi:hypothetical protein
MEIGPGRFSGRHWQPDFLFVAEDDFRLAEGILYKHFPNFDHYDINEIPDEAAYAIAREWAAASQHLSSAKAEAIGKLLHLPLADADTISEITTHRIAVSNMLKELSSACAAMARDAGMICILGV